MMKNLCAMLFLAVAVPSAMCMFGGMVSKGVNVAHAGTKLVLGEAASMTKNVPLVGKAIGSTNDFYNEVTTLKGATRTMGRSVAATVGLIGRSNIIKIIKMFRDAVLAAIEFSKKILLERLSSIPIIGDSLKNADDVFNMMSKWGQMAGIPAEAIMASYTAFLLMVNGLVSAATTIAS